jgi:hypothetical protein
MSVVRGRLGEMILNYLEAHLVGFLTQMAYL